MGTFLDASCSPVPVLDQSVFGLSGETILVVEDDLDSRQILAWHLKRLGCRVLEAADGLEAWSLLQNPEVQIVITDWTMPGLDGPGLRERIRSTGLGRYVYVILVTARESKDDVIEGLQRGADDFLPKPFHAGELVAHVRAGLRMLAFDRTVRKQRDTISQAYEKISRDLTAAATLQQSLLPRVTQPDSSPSTGLLGLRYDWLFCPSQWLAGDLLNVCGLDENHIGFFVLDVAGHGVPAAMLSMTLANTITPSPLGRSPLKHPSANAPYYRLASPSEALSDLNKRFQAGPDSLSYFTMIYGVLDCSTGLVRLTQAGHPRPIHWPRQRQPQPLGDNGFPVGLLPDVDYGEVTFVLEPGDRLVLYSDGLVDCCNPQGGAGLPTPWASRATRRADRHQCEGELVTCGDRSAGVHCGGTVIGDGVRLVGPTAIGSNSDIRPGAEIVECLLDDYVRVEPWARLHRMIVHGGHCIAPEGHFLSVADTNLTWLVADARMRPADSPERDLLIEALETVGINYRGYGGRGSSTLGC